MNALDLVFLVLITSNALDLALFQSITKKSILSGVGLIDITNNAFELV